MEEEEKKVEEKKDDVGNYMEQFIKVVKDAATPKFKLKVCCHRKGLPEMCEVITLPFKPEEGDIICVHPPTGEEGSRLTLIIHGLIYDHHLECFVLRPDIVEDVERQMNGQDGISKHESTDPMEQI